MDQAPAASPLDIMQRLRVQADITGLLKQRTGLSAADPMAQFKFAGIAAKLTIALKKLGADLRAPAREAAAFATTEPEVPAQPRVLTAKYFDFDPNRKHSDRKRDNQQAMSLLKQIEAGTIDASKLDDAQKEILARYSGTGGNLVGADGKKGSAYEYYTPKPIASGMWDMLAELGFKGGKVLDPCSGVGIFGATAPGNVAMESVELNETSGRVNQLVNGGPGYNAIISPFEAVANRTADESYDAVISNVPFGDVHDRGANRKIDPRYQDAPLETYFILRSLEKLKPGGLAAFIVPPRVVSAKGGREEKLRIAASYMAEFMGAYRLPNSVFGTADADTITDVIVFRKFGKEAAAKIEEVRQQNPAVLRDSNVQWIEFISGQYFVGEGRRFVLGEFQAKDPNKFRDVDRVISDASVANIGKMMRKFGGSRIDWKLLEATETDPISYNEGDTITLAGQTLRMQEGVWVAIGSAPENDSFDALGSVMSGPVIAVTNKVTWEQADGYVQYLRGRSMEMDMRDWLRTAHRDIGTVNAAERAAAWEALSAGLAAVEAIQTHASTPQFNYAEEYPVVTAALVSSAQTAKKTFASFSREGKSAIVKHRIVYDPRKKVFEPLWKGEGAAEVAAAVLGTDEKIANLQYVYQSTDVDVSKLAEVYGEAFSVHESDDWCVNGDGTKAKRADDYYSGNYGDFLTRINAEIAAAPEGALRDKLLRQKTVAAERVDTVNPEDLRFTLFSPFVSMEEKAEFLRRFMHPAFTVAFNDDGEKVIICDLGSPKTERERQLKRFAEYLKKGNLSTRSKDGESAELDKARRKMLRDMAMTANSQFDQWAKANPVIMSRMRETANDPSRLYFNEIDDNSSLAIPGMNPALALHGYQNAYVRKQGRSFGGINGFDVGLGKTFTALAATQYVHSIGVKKKTMFVVPNSVLSNWRREVSRAYQSMDDCLFIGLDINEKTGKAVVNSSNYARDFTRVLSNQHRKIFCTLEAFTTIPLKDETVEAYDSYLTSVDPSYEGGERKADSERAASKRADATSGTGAKSSAIPYFEDMGVDSLVIDEGHMFKNSKNTVDFAGAKFLSVAEASQRGLDMQMKAWYIRGESELNDGVLPLTATPITNSPLEIYSMLCLAVGERKVHDLMMGAKGADAFMNAMCQIEDDEDVTIDGRVKPYRVFRGLQNVNLLRSAISAIATIKTAADVKLSGDDLKLPESPEDPTAVQLAPAALKSLNEYKMAYRAAKFVTGTAAKDAPPPTKEELEALKVVQARFGEEAELIGHPFNLIQKMTLLIADPELDERATFYTFTPAQKDAADAAIAAFNKLGRIEARSLPGPHTEEAAIVGNKTIKDGDSEITLIKVKVQARIVSAGRIVIDTMDTNIQLDFEKAAEKAKLDLDCAIPPKLAAMLANVQKEEAHPRSESGRVKQLIFCDILPLHNKIKRILSKHAGIPAAAIEIISGQTIKNAEQMQGIQDGFNAEGEDNKYRTIIANEKAEVGINLQKGTQALHHLTIGWTPDSQHQRNGRGVRQGNTTGYVKIYHYDADGTFDEYKRTLTTKKSDWIGAVMDKQGANEVTVSGGLTNDQYDELIDSMGDANALAAIKDRAAMREKMARADTAKAKQIISLRTATAQSKFVKQFANVQPYLVEKALAVYDLRTALATMKRRSEMKMSAGSLIKLESRIADTEARLRTMERELTDSVTFEDRNGVKGLDEALQPNSWAKTDAKKRESIEDRMKYMIKAVEGSALHDEWQQQIDSARSMAEEAFKEFAKIGDSDQGGFPAALGESYRNGTATILDGQIFAKGMFLRDKEGSLHVVFDTSKVVRFPNSARGISDALSAGWAVIAFDSPEYTACLREAAAFDDAAEGVAAYNANMLFSSVCPDVGAYRTKPTLVRYPATEVGLPAPMFLYPINPAWEGASTALRMLGQSQASKLHNWDGSHVEVDAAGDTVKLEGYSMKHNAAARANALRAWALANNSPLTVADYALASNSGRTGYESIVLGTLQSIARWPSANDAFAIFTAASSTEALEQAAADMLALVTDGWLVLDASVQFSTFARSDVVGAFNSRRAAIRRAAEAAAYAAANPEGEAPAAEPAAAEVASVGDVAPNAKGLIGIKGDTRPHKEVIKACAKLAGGYARWNGQGERWDVPAATWDRLKADHPRIAQVLFVVPA